VGHGDLQCSGSGCDKIITCSCACGGPRQDGNKRSMPTGSGQLPPPSPWTMWLTTGSMIAIHCCGAYGPDGDHDDILAVGRHSHRHSGFNASSARGGSTALCNGLPDDEANWKPSFQKAGHLFRKFSLHGLRAMGNKRWHCRIRAVEHVIYPPVLTALEG